MVSDHPLKVCRMAHRKTWGLSCCSLTTFDQWVREIFTSILFAILILKFGQSCIKHSSRFYIEQTSTIMLHDALPRKETGTSWTSKQLAKLPVTKVTISDMQDREQLAEIKKEGKLPVDGAEPYHHPPPIAGALPSRVPWCFKCTLVH